MNYYLLLFLAMLLGAILPVQAGLNAQLARVSGHPAWSALISFAVGTLSLAVYVLATRLPTGQLAALRHTPWYFWLGGLIGAVYVACILLLLPRLGVALSFGLIITGQLTASLMLDHFGLLGLPVQPVSAGRLLGAALLVLGVWLIRKF